jgi:hypothetical protein
VPSSGADRAGQEHDHVYTTKARATSVAAATTVGRIGSVLSAPLGALVLPGGRIAYFGVIAVGMSGALLAILAIRQHFLPKQHRLP